MNSMCWRCRTHASSTICSSHASAKLLEVAADPRHLGAEIGLIGILHTWGQNLRLHPHVHCVIPAGGSSRPHALGTSPLSFLSAGQSSQPGLSRQVLRFSNRRSVQAPPRLSCEQAGKYRIGFTGHKDPSVHLRMFETADKHSFHFDTVQMPINVMDAHFRSFLNGVAPVAQERGTAILAMKTFGDHFILESKTVTPTEALHFGLNSPASVVITGIDSPAILDQAFQAVQSFRPMDQQQVAALLAKTKNAALTGKFELFKTSSHFDGTIRNPSWLGYTNG